VGVAALVGGAVLVGSCLQVNFQPEQPHPPKPKRSGGITALGNRLPRVSGDLRRCPVQLRISTSFSFDAPVFPGRKLLSKVEEA